MEDPYHPINFADTPSKKIYKQISGTGFNIDDVKISWVPLHHPQGSVAYKFQHREQTLVLATDTEHPEKGDDEKLAAFCQGSDVLVYDAMFTPEEYKDKKGWGHSTWLAGVNLAFETEVKTLYLSHLNPDYSDAEVDKILDSARKTFPQTFIAPEES